MAFFHDNKNRRDDGRGSGWFIPLILCVGLFLWALIAWGLRKLGVL